ncbi:C40 family peptidase [Hydrogenobacter sp. T-2]|uniref:C40 family peptidase n=1 Tax=Pampinifervens diazotrophicum TaxID=1632018 RepID=UPI002B261F60|nr:C40 family peptidase [Hydrogenobacter sp. T-2]WPM32783.1 C40 family peptidase [Hydrogenobacter sp. T-2]
MVGLILSFSFVFANSDNIVLTALTYMERPYQFGANDLYRMDCSAFVQRVFEVNGIRLPRSTAEQSRVGVQVGLEDLKPGDLLFFTTYRPGPSHVGIYIGNGRFVHASEKNGITINRIDEPYWSRRFLFARRMEQPNIIYTKSERQAKPLTKNFNEDEIADLIFILSNR